MKTCAIAMGLLAASGLVTSGWAGNLDRLPKDAAAVVERLSVCAHFANEEATDKARAREIEKAIRQYRCDRIDRDEAAIRKRYADHPDVVKELDETAEEY